eukprot:1673461-Pyramimonas_sp.AAC.1
MSDPSVHSLSQNPERQSAFHSCVPALIKNSVIYRISNRPPKLQSDRLAVMSEYFSMQGLPVFLPADHPAAQSVSQTLASLFNGETPTTLAEVRTLVGNGMHVAA